MRQEVAHKGRRVYALRYTMVAIYMGRVRVCATAWLLGCRATLGC